MLSYSRLVSSNLLLISNFLILKTLHKFIDFLFFLVQYFILLSLIVIRFLFLQILINFFNVSLIRFNDSSDVLDIFFCLFHFSIILLNSVNKALSSFREGKIHFISLKFKIFFTLEQSGSFFLEMLSSLFEIILLKSSLSCDKSLRCLFQHVTVMVYLILQMLIFILEFLIFVSLLWVQLLQSALIGKIDLLNLALYTPDLIFHVTLLGKYIV